MLRAIVLISLGAAACEGSRSGGVTDGSITDGWVQDDAPNDADCSTSCNPFGTWQVSYGTGNCAPGSDQIMIEEGTDGGTATITWKDRQQASSCNPQNDATYSASVTISADGCTVRALSQASWCLSGEEQCDDRDLTLRVCGNQATGSIVYTRCWCPGPSGTTGTFSANATR